MKRMNKIYENKIFTLILSLLLALILFLFVKTENYRDNPISYFQNISEISTETIYNVPVYVEGDVQDYYVSGLPESVSVELTGPHNILEQTLESNEFRVVTEDLTNIGVGTHYIQLSLDNISENISYRISPSSVNITVEELQSHMTAIQNYAILSGNTTTMIVSSQYKTIQFKVIDDEQNELNQLIHLPETITTPDRKTYYFNGYSGNLRNFDTLVFFINNTRHTMAFQLGSGRYNWQ